MSLLDLVPLTKQVAGVTVHGVSIEGILHLFRQFPELQKLMAGGNLGTADLLAVAPRAITEIIAAGLGAPGDEAVLAQAKRLPFSIQVELLSAVLGCTFPNGVAASLETFNGLLGALGLSGTTAPAAGQTTHSAKPSKR